MENEKRQTERQYEGSEPVQYSIVVPFFNEEQNVRPLYDRIIQVMDPLEGTYEMIFVDDGSIDRTPLVLAEICDRDSRVTLIQLRKNFGQSAALQAGFDSAQGDVIVALDGDLQHDPNEIPRLLAKIEEGYDVVSGWRTSRMDSWMTRQLPSRIANWLMAWLSGVKIHDFGTTFKAYRREVIQNIHLYSGYHRFIPAIASWSGARITEVPIRNVPRENGKSNYGMARTTKVLLDLLAIKFLLDYSTRPLQLLGSIGLVTACSGALVSLFLLFEKLILHEAIMLQHGPLLFVAVLLILGGIQFLSLGLLAELTARTYFESQHKPTYVVREYKNSGRAKFFAAQGPRITSRPAALSAQTEEATARSDHMSDIEGGTQ